MRDTQAHPSGEGVLDSSKMAMIDFPEGAQSRTVSRVQAASAAVSRAHIVILSGAVEAERSSS